MTGQPVLEPAANSRRRSETAKAWRTGFRRAVVEQRFLLVVVLAYLVAVYACAVAYNVTDRFYLFLYPEAAINAGIVFGSVMFLIYLYRMWRYEREPRPMRRIIRDAIRGAKRPERVAPPVISILAIQVMLSAFTSFKTMLAEINPFRYDVTFATIDRAIHFGIDPWRITHWLFGGAFPTLAIDFVYSVWFLVMISFLFLHIFRGWGRPHALRFLNAYVLLWIVVGSGMAVWLSSAGPVYYGAVTGDNATFAALMEQLRAADHSLDVLFGHGIGALELQPYLWRYHLSGNSVPGVGISAMPSMHVAMAVLCALSATRRSPRLGILFWVFAAMIQIGSVHLAWHYAIDGYVGGAMAALIWFAMRPSERIPPQIWRAGQPQVEAGVSDGGGE